MGAVAAQCSTVPLESCDTRGGPRCHNGDVFQAVCDANDGQDDMDDLQRVAAGTGDHQDGVPPVRVGRPHFADSNGDEFKLGAPVVESLSALTAGAALCNPVPSNEEHMFAELGPTGGINLPRGPKRRSVPTYATTERAELSGELRAGEVVQLRLGERIQKVQLTIFVDGFRVSATPGTFTQGYSRAWSPFTLIETCQVQVKKMEQAWAVFKLTVLRRKDADMFYYFGCSGDGAEEMRDRWVTEISAAIGRVTLSLIPAHSITVRPVPGNSDTVMRLLAGYLMLLIDLEIVALYYCELQAYTGGVAKLALYQDEWCEHEVGVVPILNTSVVSTRKGEYCTVFGVDSSLLCARTWKEKELWLRAVSNVKVKLMFDAPNPTQEELNVYRGAVLARVAEVEKEEACGNEDEMVGQPAVPAKEEVVSADPVDSLRPLLSPVRGKPKPCPRGDVWHPDPMDSPLSTPRGGVWQCQQDAPPDYTSAFHPIYDGDDYPVPPIVAPNVKSLSSTKGYTGGFDSPMATATMSREIVASSGATGLSQGVGQRLAAMQEVDMQIPPKVAPRGTLESREFTAKGPAAPPPPPTLQRERTTGSQPFHPGDRQDRHKAPIERQETA